MTGEELERDIASRPGGDAALALIAKLGFSLDFVAANVASHTGDLTVAQIAMLWQGMPNKHDRKRTQALFDALCEIGMLEMSSPGTYRSTLA